MLRLTRQADYGIVLLAHMAQGPADELHQARTLAAETQIPLPMVSKILKALSRAELLASQRGARGGYELARPAEDITLDQILTALEGPVALTDCAPEGAGDCEHEPACLARHALQHVNDAIRDSLRRLRLSEVAGPAAPGGPQAPPTLIQV